MVQEKKRKAIVKFNLHWLAAAMLPVVFFFSSCGDDGLDFGFPEYNNTGSGGTVTAPSNATITISASVTPSQVFGASPVQILTDGTVTWTNADNQAHTTTARNGDWDSGPLAPGQNFSYQFSDAGTYDYFCSVHPIETGQIEVVNAPINIVPPATTNPTNPATPTTYVTPGITPFPNAAPTPQFVPTALPTAPLPGPQGLFAVPQSGPAPSPSPSR